MFSKLHRTIFKIDTKVIKNLIGFNYREEMRNVRYMGMLSEEDELPSLPLRSLHESLKKYMEVIEPLVTPQEYTHTKQVVEQFQMKGGVGEELQSILSERAKKMDNWVVEWFQKYFYLGVRASPIYLNIEVTFPTQSISGEVDQIRYASQLISVVLEFKQLLESEALPIEYMDGQPLSMQQYKKLLASCRIPNKDYDKTVLAPLKESRYVIVAHNYHFFKLDVYHSNTDDPLNVEELAYQLHRIVQMSSSKSPHAVGILTAQQRDDWLKTFQLLSKDGENAENINHIIDSVCLICLDQPTKETTQNDYKYESITWNLSSGQMVTGGGSNQNTPNRWYDKTLQFIINQQGLAGFCFEHSLADGPVLAKLWTDIIKNEFSSDPTVHLASDLNLPSPIRFEWKITEEVAGMIKSAERDVDKYIEDCDMKTFKFTDFGKNIPKKFRISPNAYFQMAVQLAFYRMYGFHPAAAENITLRKFSNGRTDRLRTSTVEACRYVKKMDNLNITDKKKKDLLMEAVGIHAKKIKDVANFQGIEIHLLALETAAKINEILETEFFDDISFKKAITYDVEISQISAPVEYLASFVPEMNQKYAVFCNPMEHQFIFSVNSFCSTPHTDSGKFGEYIIEALKDQLKLLNVRTDDQI